MAHDTFHPFPRLPTELRLGIWRLCLPHRVSEMDVPMDWHIYHDHTLQSEDKLPCSLRSTSIENGRPPLLTRVCGESRSVAFESGKRASVFWDRNTPHRSRAEEWSDGAGNCIIGDYWQDTVRDSAHINWDAGYSADFGWDGAAHQLTSLVWQANLLNGSASMMWAYFVDSCYVREKELDRAAFKLLPKWLVVMNVIVIHLDFAQAVKTGLFGLLGEEPLQVLDASSPLVEQLYDLAETCEREAPGLTAAQDFTRMSADDMDAELKRTALRTYGDPEVPKRMRPHRERTQRYGQCKVKKQNFQGM
jgi:hypothetical protein